MPKTTLALQVDDRNVFNVVRKAFADSGSVVTELAQNALRAGATRLDICTDPKTGELEIHDNGAGVDDFSDLLTLAHSGWDGATIERTGAFGSGFFVLFSFASAVEVRSGGQRLVIESVEALLSGKARAIVEALDTPVAGTWIRAKGIAIDAPEVSRALRFAPLQVKVNGTPCGGEYAERSLAQAEGWVSVNTPLGMAYIGPEGEGSAVVDYPLLGTPNRATRLSYTHLIVEGFAISDPPDLSIRTYASACHIVVFAGAHPAWQPRFPDRTAMQIGDADVYAEALRASRQLILEARVERALSCADHRFLTTYWDELREHPQFSEALCEAGVIPGKLVTWPRQPGHYYHMNTAEALRWKDTPIAVQELLEHYTITALEDGDGNPIRHDDAEASVWECDGSVYDFERALAYLAAFHDLAHQVDDDEPSRRVVIVDLTRLPAGHPLQAKATPVSDSNVRARITGPQKTVEVEAGSVGVVEAIEMDGPLGRVTMHGPLSQVLLENAEDAPNGCAVVVTPRVDADDVVRLCCEFSENEEDWDYTLEEVVCKRTARQLKAAISTPAELLRSAMEQAAVDLANCMGRHQGSLSVLSGEIVLSDGQTIAFEANEGEAA